MTENPNGRPRFRATILRHRENKPYPSAAHNLITAEELFFR